jgi:hypothetical protein
VQQFKLSNDPKFIDKLSDVVGLYVDPPALAIVLSVDERSQIQTLDRTQPGLPMKKGRVGTSGLHNKYGLTDFLMCGTAPFHVVVSNDHTLAH